MITNRSRHVIDKGQAQIRVYLIAQRTYELKYESISRPSGTPARLPYCEPPLLASPARVPACQGARLPLQACRLEPAESPPCQYGWMMVPTMVQMDG
jgi:hypothetical protein